MILAAAFKDIHILYVLSFYVFSKGFLIKKSFSTQRKTLFFLLDIVGFKSQMVKRIVPVYGPCMWGIHASRSDSLHASS